MRYTVSDHSLCKVMNDFIINYSYNNYFIYDVRQIQCSVLCILSENIQESQTTFRENIIYRSLERAT